MTMLFPLTAVSPDGAGVGCAGLEAVAVGEGATVVVESFVETLRWDAAVLLPEMISAAPMPPARSTQTAAVAIANRNLWRSFACRRAWRLSTTVDWCD
jgi:hypothetical protein